MATAGGRVTPVNGRAAVRGAAVGLLGVYFLIAIGSAWIQVAVHGYQLGRLLMPFLVFGTYSVMGTLILWQRGSHVIGWLLEAIGLVLLVMVSTSDYAVYALVLHPGSLPLGQAAIVLGGIWIVGVFLVACLLPLTFPTGRLLSRRWSVVIVLALMYCVPAAVGNGLLPGPAIDGYPQLRNPIGLAGHETLLTNLINASIIPGGLALVGIVASMIVRFRRSAGVERQQVKFFLFGAVLMPIALLLNNIPVVGTLAFTVVLSLMGIGVALAVLRYRLYDIDVVISRTLVYGTLAAFITAVYVGIAVGIGALIGGGGKPNLALSILATAIVAVGFQPVRERVQRLANRLVYGKRATPYEVLSQFSERVAESYAADDVMPRMAQVLAEGTGAQRADVWLRSGTTWRDAAVWPLDAALAEPVPASDGTLPAIDGANRLVEVRHQGDLLGALGVTKRSGESLTPVEENLLSHLASQAGLVLRNVGLTSDLQARLEELRASRQRLVTAQDEERRRLERNLHDGAQQHLVAIKVKLGLAEMLMGRDPDKAKLTLDQLKSDADEALETLRDLARGIYPPLLADKGLCVALESQARKATVAVTVDAVGIGRHSQEVEAAAYFCVLEALQNVQKYAHASRVVIRVREANGMLSFEVDDDGAGFDVAAVKKGAGLTNMADRLDALGGALHVNSSIGHGTTIAGSLHSVAATMVALTR
jgi:signal transduction histidine kinase